MSVIVKDIGTQKYVAYVKGSPEMIAELCIQSSLPVDFDRILEQYTNRGYRVIALGMKVMNAFKFIQIQNT